MRARKTRSDACSLTCIVGVLFFLANAALMAWLSRHEQYRQRLSPSQHIAPDAISRSPVQSAAAGDWDAAAAQPVFPSPHANRRHALRVLAQPLPHNSTGAVPHYQHHAALMELPSSIRVPTPSDCSPWQSRIPFIAVSMHSVAYAEKQARLQASCEVVSVCCVSSFVPSDAFGTNSTVGVHFFRMRLIASKPLFILRTLETSSVPVVWMDIDLEFMQYPVLFEAHVWDPPRDVLLWNWQANVSFYHGRHLKMASGVAFFNVTEPAHALLLAWAETMAYEANLLSADDQALDLLVNGDGWIDRARFGWLPAAYLRMAARHPRVSPVIEHDRGKSPGSHGGGGSQPVLPPHIAYGT